MIKSILNLISFLFLAALEIIKWADWVLVWKRHDYKILCPLREAVSTFADVELFVQGSRQT